MPIIYSEATRSELLPLASSNSLPVSCIQHKGRATVYGKDYNILVIDGGKILRQEVEAYHRRNGKRFMWM